MNNDIFGLPEGASFDEITEAYRNLKARYGEDRFADGERGNEASRKLMELEDAYSDAAFRHANEQNAEKYGTDYGAADELIKRGKLDEAQAALDAMAGRTGEWHYLQSIIFYKRGWFAESKKQLRLACSLEPNNPKFASANQKMDEYVNGPAHFGPNQRPGPGGQGGGYQGQPGGYQGGPPPPENNRSYGDCCLEACCCANCLYCYCC